MPKRTCSIEDCGRPTLARGWCSAHYQRWRNHDDPLLGGPVCPAERTLAERFWSKVDVRGPDECWEWAGATNGKGYGRIKIEGRSHSAHVVAWELANEPVPKGLCVCHRCDNPLCVNVTHLFIDTQAGNVADMVAKGRGRWR